MKFEKLGNKIKQIRGISYKPNQITDSPKEDCVPILKANNITPDGLDDKNLIFISNSFVKEAQYIKQGDILLAASSGSKEIVGKNIYFNKNYYGSFGAFCKLVRPDNTISSNFLAHFFKTDTYKNHIKNSIQGANINNLKNEHIDELEIPIISYQAQLHIANILSKAEGLIGQRKESIRLLDEYLKSVFLEMFGNNTDNDKGWNKISLIDGCVNKKDVKCGPFGTQLSKSEYQEDGVPVWGIPQINSEFKILPKEFLTDRKAFELDDYSVIPYDIVMSRKGNVGKCSLFPKGFLKGIIHSDVLRIRTDDKKVHPIFLLFQLKYSKEIEVQIKGVTKGAIMSGINVGLLKHIIIDKPPLELQTQFAQIVEKAEVIKTQCQRSLQELENLYGSLSQKAFRGELVFDKEQTHAAVKQSNIVVESDAKELSAIPDNKKGFAKQVLGGKIVSLFREDPNFTRIKFQKLQYLAEHIAEEDLDWNYYRQAAGPYDNKFMHVVTQKLKQNKWFEEKSYKFYPLTKANDIDRYYQNYFGNKNDKLNELFSLLRSATEKFCEAIATIYAVWNNHIILQLAYDESLLKKEFFEWSNRKEMVFSDDEFEKALDWMQKHNITPTGFGYVIKERSTKK